MRRFMSCRLFDVFRQPQSKTCFLKNYRLYCVYPSPPLSYLIPKLLDPIDDEWSWTDILWTEDSAGGKAMDSEHGESLREHLVSRKNEVSYALQYFEGSAATWWNMHQAIQGFNGARTWEEFRKTLLRSRLIRKHYDNPKKKPCACKICGEIGHTQEEHKDGCPHCEEKHPAEECPTSQVTCFFCEGTTHYPAQCHIYPTVQQTIQK